MEELLILGHVLESQGSVGVFSRKEVRVHAIFLAVLQPSWQDAGGSQF